MMSALFAFFPTVLAAMAAEAPIARVDLPSGFYLVTRPDAVTPDTPVPLVFILHGTDANAIEMIRFWQRMHADFAMTLVAPQSSSTGWNDTDLPHLRNVLADVQAHVPHDPDRLLLTGHSAGGAMALHMLYVENFPASAAAVTACYVPPTVTPDGVRSRAGVPLFYTVGEQDINRMPMREGLTLLHDNNATVTIRTPDIGHVLDKSATQAGLDWFENLCRLHVEAVFTQADLARSAAADPGPVLVTLESITRSRRFHFPEQVNRAETLIAAFQVEGRRALAQAREDIEKQQFLRARRLLVDTERRFDPSSLAAEARTLRADIDRLPQLADVIEIERLTDLERRANAVFQQAEDALRENRPADVRRLCESIRKDYPRSAAAARTDELLAKVPASDAPDSATHPSPPR